MSDHIMDKSNKILAKAAKKSTDKIEDAYNPNDDVGKVTWTDYELLALIDICFIYINQLEKRIEQLENPGLTEEEKFDPQQNQIPF